MDEVDLSLEIIPDEEGFVSFECPFCNSDFMLKYDELGDENEMFCPYCGLSSGVSDFYPQEVIEEAEKIVFNYATEELNKMVERFKKNNNKYVKWSYKPMKKLTINNITCEKVEAKKNICPNCGKKYKALFSNEITILYCPYCGDNL